MAATREQQLEQRIGELEHIVAQLIRGTYTVAQQFGRSGNGWETWLRAGASHQAVTDLHAFLRAHPAPSGD